MASSNPAGAKRLPTIFFTPGAWHEPWVFDSVRSALSARGFDSEVSPLVTVGCTDASVGLSADVAQTRSALMDVINQGKEVLVVAHSYGAIVASNAVEGLSVQQRAVGGKEGGVLMVLYLAGFVVPAKGSIMITLEGKYPPFWIISDVCETISPASGYTASE
jgi:hypothetical protein